MKYAGMTVNERLFASGNMSAFDEAVSETKNGFEKIKTILKSVELADESIELILKSIISEKKEEE